MRGPANCTKDIQPVLHQDVVVGDVPSRQPELLDAGLLSELDPDLGQENAFQVGTYKMHMCFFHLTIAMSRRFIDLHRCLSASI
jgi:hypothetical protein